jgi:hypothetical protein
VKSGINVGSCVPSDFIGRDLKGSPRSIVSVLGRVPVGEKNVELGGGQPRICRHTRLQFVAKIDNACHGTPRNGLQIVAGLKRNAKAKC